MTKEEIEKEIQARVDFKMKELMTGIKNRAWHAWEAAFNENSPAYAARWEAMKELEGMIQKEIDMPIPYDSVLFHRKHEAKDIAVERMMEFLEPMLRGRRTGNEVNKVVSIIEAAQNY